MTKKEDNVMKKITLAKMLLSMLLVPSISQCTASYNVAVIGTGYVGSVLGACLASFNHKVICVDTNKEIIARLKRGEMTIYEHGLAELIAATTKNNYLTFSDDPASAIRNSDIVFIAVGTPMTDDGNADLRAIESVARSIGENLNGYKIICTKSTVPIGTGARIKHLIAKHSHDTYDFDVVSNPEFLREGSSIDDFLNPDRIIIGSESDRPCQSLYNLYYPFHARNIPFLFTTRESAETIKYASNSFLATKISFINEIANLCEKVGADILEVVKGIGLDSRIGSRFLLPGPGYGGSCFPKDVEALLFKGNQVEVDLKIAHATRESNRNHKLKIFDKVSRLLNNNVASKKVAILGLAFKANTDDVRESIAIDMVEKLSEKGAFIAAYDPEGMSNMKKLFPHITYASTAYEALQGADAALILTEWDEFKSLDLAYVKTLLRQPVLLDARNILNTKLLKELGFTFENIGNATVRDNAVNKP